MSLQRITSIVVALAATVSGGSTDKAVFTRWGSRSCPAGTSMLYEGIAAGASHDHRGSGANALCLHGNNFQGNTLPGSNTANNDGGLLYGTEYENTGALDGSHDQDASCAVCQTDTPGEVYTQWGRAFGCSNGHITMYNGHVMSSHYTQQRSEFVCVDTARESHQMQNGGNQNGQLWYTVETEGGSMDENLYPQDKEVGCSVCHAPRAVYTRWGSNSCTKGSTLMYKGIASGSHYSHRGGGHNNLCLHTVSQTPLGWGGNNNGGLLYGVEYQNSGAVDKNNDKDAACSVCMADVEGHAYIQWGRSKSCSNSHVTLYSGFVLSEHYSHYKGEFQCVDDERAFHAASNNGDSNGALWYSTEVESGAMDESKYTPNLEIGCSMCLAPKATYVAWGSTDCKKDSGKLLYTGYAASSYYNDRGGGANALCLHSSPEVAAGASTGDQNGGRLFGTEYENTGAVDKNGDLDAACAVCELETSGMVYTQWGRSNACSNEHYTLYQGIVMSNHYTQNKNEFVCVSTDRAAHAKSSTASNNGNLWYTVEVEGGSMDESIYEHNVEIGCVVCVSDEVPRVVPWYEEAIFTDLVKKVDAHATDLAKKETIANVKTLTDKVNTKAATTALTSLDSKVNSINTELNTAITSGISQLKIQVDNDRKSFGDSLVAKVGGAFSDSSNLDLPQVPSRFDWGALCNGQADASTCGDAPTCNTTEVTEACPVACGTCVVAKTKSSIKTSSGKLIVKVNQGETLIIDNGYEDTVMTQTSVEDLVKAAISAAFEKAAAGF